MFNRIRRIIIKKESGRTFEIKDGCSVRMQSLDNMTAMRGAFNEDNLTLDRGLYFFPRHMKTRDQNIRLWITRENRDAFYRFFLSIIKF